MALIYYAKVNINSDIYSVYSKKVKVGDIMNQLYERINNEVEITMVQKWQENNGSQIIEREKEEIYCFADIKKSDSSKKYIFGRVIRRFPLFTEEYDEDLRTAKKVVHDKNAASITFYFDLSSEIVAFNIRQHFKQLQFMEAFRELINHCMDTIAFEVFLINDPRHIRDRIKNIYRIEKIKSVVVPPNANEELLKDIYDKGIKNMEEANVGKKTSIFETSNKSKKGINIESQMVKEVLSTNEKVKVAKGYGVIEIEGRNRDGSKIFYNSDEHSPYISIIDDEVKHVEPEFISASQQGILIIIATIMSER